jgi:hypothetical protein
MAMIPKATKGGGICIAFPDVCKVPVPVSPIAPIPYPNIAKTAQDAQKTKATASKPAAKKGSAASRSRGDEAGVLKGIVSSKARGELQQIRASLNVLNARLQAMKSNDPDQWQKVLRDYVVAASALFVTQWSISNDKG